MFVGRISCSLKFEEMPLSDCREFWGSAKTRRSVHEMLDLLCVTGGIPKYLTEMRPSLSADENIRKGRKFQAVCFGEVTPGWAVVFKTLVAPGAR